jgi:hypothetical protein
MYEIQGADQVLLTGEKVTRRSFVSTAAVGAGAFAFGIAAVEPACSPKNLSTWITTITSAFAEVKPLLPQLGLNTALVAKVSDLVDKGARIARLFDEAYRAGKFADAVTLFSNLGDVIAQVASELGATDNRIVRLALVSISIARIAVATLLNNQADATPQVAAAVSAASGDPAVQEVKRLAATDISSVEKALKQ